MEPISSSFQNNDSQLKKFIYCSSGHCLNIPEIHYSNNLLKTEFRYKCECQKNNNNKNMNLN